MNEDMRRKRLLHFRSQWPWHLDFRTQICSPSYSQTALCFHQIRSFYTSILFEKKGMAPTDWRTGCKT